MFFKKRNIGYKGYLSNMKSVYSDFQYKENTIFSEEAEPSLCSKGFHFCTEPLEVLAYYPLINENNLTLNKYSMVEALRETYHSRKNSKSCTNKIKILSNITFEELVKKQENTDRLTGSTKPYDIVVNNSNNSIVASTGFQSCITTFKSFAQIHSAGPDTLICCNGVRSRIYSSGAYSQITNKGNRSHIIAIGEDSTIIDSGAFTSIKVGGDRSVIIARNCGKEIQIKGQNSRVIATGFDIFVTGVKGTTIIFCPDGAAAQSIVIDNENDWYYLDCHGCIRIVHKQRIDFK